MRKRAAAFTLVELLIALAIMALLVLGAYRGLTLLLEGERHLAAEQDRWRTLARVFDRLEADLQRALPRSARSGEQREASLLGTNHEDGDTRLRFTRAGDVDALHAAAGQRVEYRTRARRLELALWPSWDNVPESPAQVVTLLEDVDSVRLRFASRTGWVERWPTSADANALPRAVEISLRPRGGAELQRIVVLP